MSCSRTDTVKPVNPSILRRPRNLLFSVINQDSHNTRELLMMPIVLCIKFPLLKENPAASLLYGCRKVTAKKSFAAELEKSSQDFAASSNVIAILTKALQKLFNFLQPAGNFATGSPEKHQNAIKHHRFAKRIIFFFFFFFFFF